MTLRIGTPHQSSEADSSPDEYEKTSISYNSESAEDAEIRSSSIGSRENNLLDCFRDECIIDKLKPNSKSKIK